MERILGKLWLYNEWANTSLIEELAKNTAVVPDVSLHLLSHIMNAQMIWLCRINGEKCEVGVWDDHDLQTCAKMHSYTSAGIREALENHTEVLTQKLIYRNTRGISHEKAFEDIFLHIFNHGTYHRAQIAQNLRINGLTPINTDYIYFSG